VNFRDDGMAEGVTVDTRGEQGAFTAQGRT